MFNNRTPSPLKSTFVDDAEFNAIPLELKFGPSLHRHVGETGSEKWKIVLTGQYQCRIHRFGSRCNELPLNHFPSPVGL